VEWDGRFLTHALQGAALAASGEALLYLWGRPSAGAVGAGGDRSPSPERTSRRPGRR